MQHHGPAKLPGNLLQKATFPNADRWLKLQTTSCDIVNFDIALSDGIERLGATIGDRATEHVEVQRSVSPKSVS